MARAQLFNPSARLFTNHVNLITTQSRLSTVFSTDFHHRHRPYLRQSTQTRSFFPSPFASTPPEPILFSATRTLPYSRPALFSLISDIESYPHFIPFCESAQVHTQSPRPDPIAQQRWPATATLDVGVGPYREAYLSRVFCTPYVAVEAISGPEARTSLARESLEHYDLDGQKGSAGDGGSGGGGSELFRALRATWTLKDSLRSNHEGKEWTDVSLAIEAHHSSAIVAAMWSQVGGVAAEPIIEAFERRASQMLGNGGGERSSSG